VRDPHDVVEALTLEAGDSSRAIDLSLRFARPDVEQAYAKSEHRLADPRIGFAAFLPGPAAPGGQHRFELRLRSGASLPLVAVPAPSDPAAARNAVLAAVPSNSATAEAVTRCIGPAAAALHRQHLARRRAPELIVFGNPPRRPRASIIVPLYRNLDFLRFQLAAFAVDRALRDVELIYVLDSPEQRESVEHMLEGFHGLYGLPLKLVVMSSNFGYAAANNAGVAHAEGRLLLLLNSDVVPASPGWFDAMAAAFEAPAGRKIGAVGPKLLFDDGSLQHAGLFFRRDRRGRWFNDHYFKGMPRDFPAACRAGRVPAVTGAAVMVPGAAFRAVGGFTEDYIIGDYEDSDLCLKLRRAGRDILYVPAAELHHFERKSIERHAGYMRGVASEYNGWLHHQRWDTTIAALMDEFAPAIRAERRRVSA
jgi:GT2 family glycosyltransferase